MEKMKSAIIITTNGYEDPELEYPFYRLLEADFRTAIATPMGVEVVGQWGTLAKNLVKPNPLLKIESLVVNDYDLLYVPGGRKASIELKANSAALQFVEKFFKSGSLVASICHGPWVLALSGILKGLKATCYPNSPDLIEDLKNSGANYISDPDNKVVVDKNVITSLRPATLPQFMKAVLKEYKK